MQTQLKKLLTLPIIHKRFLFPLTGLILVFSLFPLHTADAILPIIIGGALLAGFFIDIPVFSEIVDGVGGLFLEALLTFFNIILGVIAAILQGFYTGIGTVMHEIIRYFMGIPISPASPDIIPFVKEAFTFSQMFVNSIFILVLVFIGLATILRIQSYQIQRTLPLLLIVALLVNFSGVLVGFIVDMGNIVAVYFLNNSIDSSWWTHPWQGINLNAENVGQNIARILYYAVGSFIYFIVMLLFGVRVIILWTLTILAPFAFAALVLPATRSYWTQWWSQLIQWSIIGIPISFFLYLSGRAISADLPAVNGIDQLIVAMFAPISALVLLLIGVMFSMQLAPAGASKVVDFGKKWATSAAMAAGGAVWRKFEGANIVEGGGRISGAGSRLRKWGGGNATALQQERSGKEKELQDLKDSPYTDNAEESKRKKVLESEITGLKVDEEKAKEKESQPWYRRPGHYTGGLAARVVGGAIEFSSKEATMRLLDRDVKQQEEATKEVAGRDSWAVFNMYNQEKAKGNLANKNRMVGLLNGIRERGDSDDIEDAIKDGSLKGEDIGMSIITGERAGPPQFRPLLKSFYSQIMLHPEKYGFNATSKKDAETGKMIFEGKDAKWLSRQLISIPTKFTNQDFQGDTIAPENFDMSTEEGRFFMQTIAETRGADFMAPILRRARKKEGISAFQFLFKQEEHAEDGLGIQWLAKNAPDILRYGTSTAAQGLGIGIAMERREVEQIILEARRPEGQTREILLSEKANLQVKINDLEDRQDADQLGGPALREQIGRAKTDISQIDSIIKMMDRPLEELQSKIENLQQEITTATNSIQANSQDVAAYVAKAQAEASLAPLEIELRKRGPGQSTQDLIAKDLTYARTRLQAQLDAKTQGFQNIIQQAQSSMGEFAPSDVPELEKELETITADIKQQLQGVAIGLEQIEGIRVPKAPFPLPTSKSGMPSPLRGAIKRGEKVDQAIKDITQEMQRSLQGISDTQTDFNEIIEAMEGLKDQVAAFKQQEQDGTLGPELQTQRDELKAKLLDLAESRRDLGEHIQQQTETTIRTREVLDSRRADLQNIREEIAPLFEEYGGVKEREGTEVQKRQRKRRQKE